MNLARNKGHLIVIILIIFFGIIVFYPSANIHFDGDSLLTLYRFPRLVGEGREHNYFNYFITDYGPQDIVFAIIRHFYGLNPTPYFIVSFILRVIASFSFFPLVASLYKDKKLAYFASTFFLITSTGLETTGWVFNMPTYIAIAFFNFYLLSVFKSKEGDSIKLIVISTILFGLTIVIQPIRMAFLPLLGIFIEVLYLLKFKKTNFKFSIARISIYLLLIFSIFLFGEIGGSIGIQNIESRLSGGFINNIFNYFSDFRPESGKYEFKYFLYPVSQIGYMIFPNRIILKSWESLDIVKTLLFVVIPSNLIFGFSLRLFRAGYATIKQKYFEFAFWIGFVWTLTTTLYFNYFQSIQLTTSQLLSYFAGGYLLILITIVLFNISKNRINFLRLLVIVLLIGFGYLIFWLRNPTAINATQERYLIVSAVGVTLLLSAFVANAKYKIPIYIFFTLAILVHAFSTWKYLKHLSDVRGVELTEKIRNAVPNVFDKSGDTPILFYFQSSNSEVLHHSLLFGFPLVVYFQHEIDYPWRVVYTTDWQEVISALKDGESTKSYTGKKEVVTVDSVYSFLLEGDALINTTQSTRQTLIEMMIGNR